MKTLSSPGKNKWVLDSVYERADSLGFICTKRCTRRRKPIDGQVFIDISLISSFSPTIQLRLDSYLQSAMFYLVMSDVCSSYQCINKVAINRIHRKNGLRETLIRMKVYRLKK
jgi:hypothetical protein